MKLSSESDGEEPYEAARPGRQRIIGRYGPFVKHLRRSSTSPAIRPSPIPSADAAVFRWTVIPTVFPTTEEVTAMADKKITQHRSAKSGEFVTKQYAEKHKSTTVTERNNAPKPSPSKSRGK